MNVRAVITIVVLTGCSTPSEPVVSAFQAFVASGSRTFVLSAAEEQRGEWITTFDHRCDNGHFEIRTRGSIELSPDGSARRERWIEHLRDGGITYSTHLTSSGTWTNPSGANVILTLKSTYGSEAAVPVRITGSTTLSTREPMGGACLGSPDDSRMAEFFYTAR